MKFAIALQDDSVKVYTGCRTDVTPTLKHKLQKGVADVAWRYSVHNSLGMYLCTSIADSGKLPSYTTTFISSSYYCLLIVAQHPEVATYIYSWLEYCRAWSDASSGWCCTGVGDNKT